MNTTDFQAKYFASELTAKHADSGVDKLSRSLFDASVDLNPHQIHAALFALNNPLSQGVVLADEVGLGKTIEAGLVLSQYWAENRRKILIICPASLRCQWAQELQEKFNLSSQILDAKTWTSLIRRGDIDPLSGHGIVIMSYHYAVKMEQQIRLSPWDLVVIDEAHKLRNAHRKTNKMGQVLRIALNGRKKLLLTATPLQNSLMELYGLSTVIDEQLFGDEKSFKQNYINNKEALGYLKNRLSGFIQRTLRKDVLEYIRYTQRQTLTVPFTPSDAEMDLYDGISSLLEKENSYALPKSQRHLTGLILRKLLASSSYAVLNTLETILKRLKELQQQSSSDVDLITCLIDEDDLNQEYTEEMDSSSDQSDEPINQHDLATEIKEIELYIKLAKRITTDSKSNALLVALTQGFLKMEEMGAPRKVIIFTESKRTQDYLTAFLSAHGYADKLVTFSGSNNHPQATQIYQQWLKEQQDLDQVSGSPQIDRRTALIDYFRDHAEIMIATEAAAEGVNLQFCSLIINYDLPWNPQRVEQRIGRCHRYGQLFDVVVINFLNQENKADQRVLELLTEKFHLFNGVFGASDDVLGNIESGIDFEKRIQTIYDTCRLPSEIEAAFNQLQQELDADITKKMEETKKLLLDNFDEDIHNLLKVQLDVAQQRLDKVGRWFWWLTCHELQHFAQIDSHKHRFHLDHAIAGAPKGYYQLIRYGEAFRSSTVITPHIYRLTHPLGEWVLNQALNRPLENKQVQFDLTHHPTKISMLEPLIGTSGTLCLQKISVESLERGEDHLIFAIIDHDGQALSDEYAQKMMQLSATVNDSINIDIPAELHQKLHQQLALEELNIEKKINERNLVFFEQEVAKLDQWADDLKEGLEATIKELDKEIKLVRRDAKIAVSLEDKLSLQKQQRQLENQRNKSRRELFDKQDEIDLRRETLIGQLESKLNKKIVKETLFTIEWAIH